MSLPLQLPLGSKDLLLPLLRLVSETLGGHLETQRTFTSIEKYKETRCAWGGLLHRDKKYTIGPLFFAVFLAYPSSSLLWSTEPGLDSVS